jgi:queuine tRNA-ribosyltransferase
LAARRANPLPINASWDDRIEINTIDGRSQLPIETALKAVSQAKLREGDVVIGVPDMTEAPGVKRLMKMIQRTEKWLSLLLEQKPGCRVYASIPPIPPSRAPALLDDYMDFLAESVSQLSGIAIYNIFPDHPITEFLPDEVSHLPILLIPSPLTPHEILRGIISDGVGEFTAGGMVTAMSDLGIALDFTFFGTEGEQIPLGRDMFDSSNEVDMGALVEGCECFTCTNHHRAYIHHLLNCHEMTAWVLLQLYPRLPPLL